MSNYNQYYYNGDTINARVVEDGFAVDLRSLATRAKMYDPEYRSGVGKMLNSIYERKFGHESGISDNALGLEIFGHAMGYDFTTGLELGASSVAETVSSINPIVKMPAQIGIKRGGNWAKERLEEANVGRDDTFRPLFEKLGEKIY